MEIRPTPDQKILIEAAIEAGRFATAEDAVKEALALWEERERQAALAELRASLDEADADVERGEYTELTPEAMRRLKEDIAQHCRASLAKKATADR